MLEFFVTPDDTIWFGFYEITDGMSVKILEDMQKILGLEFESSDSLYLEDELHLGTFSQNTLILRSNLVDEDILDLVSNRLFLYIVE